MKSILSFKFMVFAIASFSISANAQNNDNTKKVANLPQVKVFKNFVGKGYDMAKDAAILNSKKGVLIALISSNDSSTKLHSDLENILQSHMAMGRTRMVIILADKPGQGGIRDHVALYANGNWKYTAFEKGNNGLGSGLEFSKAVQRIYDADIKPLNDNEKAECLKPTCPYQEPTGYHAVGSAFRGLVWKAVLD